MKILVEFKRGDVSVPARVKVLREASAVDPFGKTAPASSPPAPTAPPATTEQDERVIAEIAKSLGKKNNETVKTILLVAGRPTVRAATTQRLAAEMFWKQAKSKLPIKSLESFRFLGAGAVGLAFEVDGMVLKLEAEMNSGNWKSRFASVDKLGKATRAQWAKKEVGVDTPMIYNSGNFEFQRPNSETWAIQIYWFFLEKFETVEGEKGSEKARYQRAIGSVVEKLRRRFSNRSVAPADFDEIVATIKKDASKNASYKRARAFYRLQDDWVERLGKAMIRMSQEGMASDYHIGNIGIRRSGSEGYAVFFD